MENGRFLCLLLSKKNCSRPKNFIGGNEKGTKILSNDCSFKLSMASLDLTGCCLAGYWITYPTMMKI
jgi:hypothetical protein